MHLSLSAIRTFKVTTWCRCRVLLFHVIS